ncbi:MULTISPECIES: Ig-like domain-containing protein [unclassified Methanoculleus]|uniref:Ig-like domain-containing protein n=1 Tax=unclassified Methanoculleus TaxID=2619537 RepID=UPI0025D473BB|nr:MULTISPECIES: Ig-like domain-containing protein [unclassified Methanoculleus]
MAVEVAPGSLAPFIVHLGSQEHPDVDGNMVVWEDGRNGNKEIYFSDSAGYIGDRITENAASQERPSISGDYIIWQDYRNGNWDIYLYNRVTKEETQLTSDTGKQWLPAISGNYAAWYDDSSGETNVVLYDIADETVKDVIECDAKTTIPYGSTDFKPALSEKYVAWVEEADGRIQYYDIATETTVGRVSTSTAIQSWPSIFGDIIVWEDYRHGFPEVYMSNLITKDETRLTTSGVTDTGDSIEQVSPAISGDIVIWEDKWGTQRTIHMRDLSTGKEFSVPTAGGEQLYPAVSGNTIVWQKSRDISSDIYVFVYNSEGVVHELTRIEVEPSTVTVKVGDEIRFNATCYDENDNAMHDLKVSWTCDNGTVGFIDPGGYFNASAAGTATITASIDDIFAKATVTVNADEPVESVVTSIEVTPTAATLEIDGTEQFAATALDQFGEEMTVEFDWASDNETVGTVDNSSGLFTAKAAGTATVTATAEGVTGTAIVTVTDEEPVATSITVAPAAITLEIDDTVTFSAAVLDQFGGEMSGVDVAWESSDPTVGTIDADGLFTALATGNTTVTATAGDASGTAAVTVSAEGPVLESIEVAPAAVTLEIDGTEQFTATAFDQFGNEMSGVEIAWTGDNETVGTVDNSSGLFTALAAGTATVTASAGDVSGTATVTVEETAAPVVASIEVTPVTATIMIGDTQEFDAVCSDESGNTMPGVPVTWSCSDPTVGTVDDTGLFTALAAGTATVTASAGDVSRTATVTVCAEEPALAKIAVVPSAATLEIGDSLQFDAVAFDRFGNIVEDAGITWECSDSCVGEIDECGVFTALDDGTATVTACGDGAEGTATVTVNCDDPVLSSIVVTPSVITLAKNDTAAFTATALDQDGCEMSGVMIDWECSDPCVGTIDLCSGVFTAEDCGTTTVTASADGVTAKADVKVIDCSGIGISPSAIILDPEDKWQFTVYGLQDNAGSIMDWSADPCVGTITQNGLFTAVCEGTTSVTATVDGVDEVEPATVTVRSTAAPELARIEVSPSDFCIPAGHSLTLTARGFDQYGYEMPDVEVTWDSSDKTVGTIDDCGVFTALSDGEVSLTASADGISGSACVTVLPSLPVPACIEVEPATATLAPGATREFTATVFDQCENVMDWVRVRWSCTDENVGTIDRAGLFAAFAGGSADVTACAGGVEGSAAVTVTAAPTTEPTTEPTPTPTNPGSTKRASSDGGGWSPPTISAGICEGLKSGETFTFSDITVSSVGSVAITAANNIPKMLVTVKETGCPTLAEPPGGTYEYVEIALSWVNQNDISNGTLTFTVPAKWLEEHDMLPEDVRLMRYVDGGWQILETEVIGEENGNYRFRATTPGFSTFAIAAMPDNLTVTTNATNEEGNVTATVTATEEMTTEATAVPTTTPAAPLVYAPFLAPLAFLLWRRRKN